MDKKSCRRLTCGGDWSPQEDELMRTIYPTSGVEVVMQSLPGRTRVAVMSRAKHLQLKLTKEARARVIAQSRAARAAPEAKPEPVEPDAVAPEYIQAADIFQVGFRIASQMEMAE